MNDWYNDPPETPEPPVCPACKCSETDIREDGVTCSCDECGNLWTLPVETDYYPEMNNDSSVDIPHGCRECGEPTECVYCEKCADKVRCPHGNRYGDCGACDHAGDLAYDASRESA